MGSPRKPWKNNNQRDRHGNRKGHGPPKAGCPCPSVYQNDPLGNEAKNGTSTYVLFVLYNFYVWVCFISCKAISLAEYDL